jgi:branched-chain amino acid transport system substrate-binding protein
MKYLVPLVLLTAMAATTAVAKSPGVSDSEIVFGQTAAIAGPARALGVGMRVGITTAFEEANRAGGVHGRRLRLETLNDSYEPEAAIENTRRLIDKEKVFALIGSVGTPTSRVSEPIATAAGVPFIGPFTGASVLRVPYRPTVINIRASYGQETEEIVDRLTTDLGIKRIAVLFQDDSYGQAGLAGVRAALHKRKMKVVGEGSYIRNTIAVKTALLKIRDADPQAVVVIGAYQPSAVFTKWAHKLGLKVVIANISFVGSAALAADLGPDGKGVIVSQVVPFPEDTSLPLVRQYQQALKSFDAKALPDFVSLEGYLVGRVTVEALARTGRDVTREAFLNVFSHGKPFDIGGVTLTFGPSDNQGLDSVFMTMIDDDGQFVPISRIDAQ